MAGSHWTSTGGAEFTAIELINFIFLKGCEVRCYLIESQLHLSLIKAQGRGYKLGWETEEKLIARGKCSFDSFLSDVHTLSILEELSIEN